MVNDSILEALRGFIPQVLPEAFLGLMACVLFLGATWKVKRNVWGLVALVSLGIAGVLLVRTATTEKFVEDRFENLPKQAADFGNPKDLSSEETSLRATVYAAPVTWTRLGLYFKWLSLVAGALLVLLGWNEATEEHAGEYFACLLLITVGASLVGSANDLITLFLALELISIPTYVLLYLPRVDAASQEAAIKYFLLSVFSSALLLFGFSYLYGLTGTTNIPGLLEELSRARSELRGPSAERPVTWEGMALVALVMVVAGLGFKIAAVPFHFYAPDVYQGTTTTAAALLSFVPKIAGFAALIKLLGFAPDVFSTANAPGGSGTIAEQALGGQAPVLLWIMAAVTMSLGNVLALLQDNIKRMLGYSSVAHAGYMLIGLAVAPRLVGGTPGAMIGGVEAVLFYLAAYGAMTVGAFAVLAYWDTPDRPVETVDDLAGASKSHPGMALVFMVFLLSLIGIPLTAGFLGKFFLFFDAVGLGPVVADGSDAAKDAAQQVRLYRILAVIGAVNAAAGAYYYLRMIAVMYLREAIDPMPTRKPTPALATIALCAIATVVLGVYPGALVDRIKETLPKPPKTPAGFSGG